MLSDEAIRTQNRILGVLLRKARLDARRSVEECAEALACDPELISRAEEGANGLSLPQLEILSHVLDVPLSLFLDGGKSLEEEAAEPLPYENIMIIRRKIIGVILRQARLEVGQTLDELALRAGMVPEYLARVELGDEQISLVRLQMLADALGIPFQAFVAEDVIPLSSEEQSKRDLRQLAHLPPEAREFVLKPINIPYLQIAMNLSEMPAETLRQIASGLLEITY
jgi:transcriptional regulator with XRE-family HTH domain